MQIQTKQIVKWIAPTIKIISTMIIVILLAAVYKEASPYPYLVVSICTLVPFALILAKKLFKLNFPIGVDFAVLLFIIMAADLGSAMGLYGKIGCFDLIVHGYFGFICSVIMLYFWRRYSGAKPTAFGLICIFLIAMGFAALWECWEFTSDLIFKQGTQGVGISDTMTDILITAAGSLIFEVTYFIDKKTNGKIYRLQ